MKFILTKIPVVEDALVSALAEYFGELQWEEMYPNHPNINLSNDHPFEELLGGTTSTPNLFPSITVASSSDNESNNMAKGWAAVKLDEGDFDDEDNLSWYVSDGSLANLKTALYQKKTIYGLQHQTVWRDAVSFEIWTENMQVKNDLYNLLLGFLSGPKILQLKQDQQITVFSNTISGQRSGYYNFDFGRVLYGGRISFSAEYPVLQAVYDTEIGTVTDILHSYREVLHG